MKRNITGKKNGVGNGNLFKQNSFRILAVIIIMCLMLGVVWNASSCKDSNEEFNDEISQQDNTSGYSVDNKDMLRLVITADDCKSGDLILVNKDNPYEDTPENLVSVLEHSNKTYTVSDYNVKLNSRVCEALNSWLGEFYREYGETNLLVASGYRSVDTQESIYEDDVSKRGQEVTDKWIAVPGTSEHHTGLAVDMSIYNTDNKISEEFDGEGIYKNLLETCDKYGFIVRYPEDKTEITGIDYEPWHFRYVGKGHASYITENNLCLEEYIELLKNHTYQNPLTFEYDSTIYGVFWFDEDEIPYTAFIPDGYQYNISSDNCGCVIVTYFKKN